VSRSTSSRLRGSPAGVPGLAWEQLFEHFDAITASGYSVSVFTRWASRPSRCGSRAASRPSPGRSPEGSTAPCPRPAKCTDRGARSDQLHAATRCSGPVARTPAHFRTGFTPSSGEEIQSEYLSEVARATAVEALRRIAATLRPLLLVSEIRTVAADRLWLSRSTVRTPSRSTSPGSASRSASNARSLTSSAPSTRSSPAALGQAVSRRRSHLAPRYERLDDFAACWGASIARRVSQRVDRVPRARRRRLRTHAPLASAPMKPAPVPGQRVMAPRA